MRPRSGTRQPRTRSFRSPWLAGRLTSPVVFTPFHRGGAGPPMVCLHGFGDTWRAWGLVLPALERRHDVLAVTLAGHAGGPRIEGVAGEPVVLDAVERAMDDAGFDTAHVV